MVTHGAGPGLSTSPLSSTLHYSHLSTFPIQTHASGRLEACVSMWTAAEPSRAAHSFTTPSLHFHFVPRPLNVRAPLLYHRYFAYCFIVLLRVWTNSTYSKVSNQYYFNMKLQQRKCLSLSRPLRKSYPYK